MEDQLSDQSGDRDSDFNFMFATPKQRLDGTSQFEHYLSEPQLTEADQDLYKNFPLVISERWQAEVADTVFETINVEADKVEMKKKAKQKLKFDTDEKGRAVE
ncbi:hypothetical protein PR048_026524 [Dryococelus australis]|uniref:G protein-coupled receptor kinase n=1 Tax=Dryococelus australis TaxID=614101 RepID=A0ABQ9GLL1_9NEOP|nr:hypothetical protein PR048_026524 [Dryococelus australis]